jgi:hypothetical protein
MKLPSFISATFKKFKRSGSQAGGLKAPFNFNLIFWGVLSAAILAELFVAYNSLYQNTVFADQPQTIRSANVTRINTENYSLVKARLEIVRNYTSTSSIDFLGTKFGIGRSNPFADPE